MSKKPNNQSHRVSDLNDSGNPGRNQHQQTGLLVHEVQEHHHLAETPPRDCMVVEDVRAHVCMRLAKTVNAICLTCSRRESNHCLPAPPKTNVVLESQEIKQQLWRKKTIRYSRQL